MTSLIGWTIYGGHKAYIERKRSKQRVKNYERWEDLRDDYDAQRKITRERRSLDVNRTGDYYGDSDRPIVTMRDQQEADDARTSWRPQEVFDGPTRASVFDEPRRASADMVRDYPTYAPPPQPLRPMQTQKTGVTWDEGLPPPLRVSRRNWDDDGTSSRQSSTNRGQTSARNNGSMVPQYDDRLGVGNSDSARVSRNPSPNTQLGNPFNTEEPSRPTRRENVEPIESDVPGGMMAQLIERGY